MVLGKHEQMWPKQGPIFACIHQSGGGINNIQGDGMY